MEKDRNLLIDINKAKMVREAQKRLEPELKKVQKEKAEKRKMEVA